jgi:hypothetical protein
VDRLISWTVPDEGVRDRNTPQPALLVLHWGEPDLWAGLPEVGLRQYSLFDASGEPLRATRPSDLRGAGDAAGDEPDVRGGSGRRSAVAGAGDTLAALAYRGVRRPQPVARDSRGHGIDDPSAHPGGHALLVPPLAEAGRLSAVSGA